MTDKTPKNTAETAVNTPTTLALPQADALKARFKAGSIPLQTDFADLIDIANMGRQAVGDEGTGFGLVKDSKNRLRFDPLKMGNFTYDLSPSKNDQRVALDDILAGELKDHSRIALLALGEAIGPDVATATKVGDSTTYTVNAVKIDDTGNRNYTKVKIIASKSVGKSGVFLPFEYVNNTDALYSLWYTFRVDTTDDNFSNCTLVIDPLTFFVKKITDFSTSPLEGEIISLITFNFVYHGIIVGDGLQVNNMKIAAKIDVDKGLQVNNSGISIKTGNGVVVNSSGVNIKLAKGANTNGGGGHGTDGATSGPAGGLNLSASGLSVDAGDGMQINARGVSIRLAANSGLSADEGYGLKVVPEQQFQKGMVMMFSGTGIPSGWALCDGNNGTPNLVDRFIIGGKGSDVGKTGGQSLTGSGNNKSYTVNTNAASAGGISVNISGTTLEAKHLPPHAHNIQYAWNNEGVGFTVAGVVNARAVNLKRGNIVDAYGNNAEAHTHSGTASQGTHAHTINSLPAYYILAFIMKL